MMDKLAEDVGSRAQADDRGLPGRGIEGLEPSPAHAQRWAAAGTCPTTPARAGRRLGGTGRAGQRPGLPAADPAADPIMAFSCRPAGWKTWRTRQRSMLSGGAAAGVPAWFG